LDDRATTQPAVRPHSRAIVALVLGAVVTACNQSPVAPAAPTAQSLQASRPLVTIQGFVRDPARQPIEGATVSALDAHGDITSWTETDSSGAYSLSFNAQSMLQPFRVSREDLETSRYFVDLSHDDAITVRKDFRLHEIRRILAGTSADVTIDPDDPVCIDGGEILPCRTIRVVDAGADFVSAWVDVGRARIRPAGSQAAAGSRVDVFLPAGGEIVIEVMAPRPPLTFTIHTSYDWM
jgi:hypothetical protein